MKQAKTTTSREVIFIQERLRPARPEVLGCKDYREFEKLLERADEILRSSGIEDVFLGISVERYQAAGRGEEKGLEQISKHAELSRQALRCTILKNLLSSGYREMSQRLAECALFRWFCCIPEFEKIKVPGKSTLQTYANWLPEEQMQMILDKLTQAANQNDGEEQSVIGLIKELELKMLWVDTTCIKANIHYPSDWVLLRDGTRTLIKSVIVIRKHGLKHRIGEPTEFISAINSLCMQMTAAARKPDGKRQRKRKLRELKRLSQLIGNHGKRYYELLDKEWEKTDWTRKQAEVVLRRMRSVLEQLPQAIKQAHERIIGERQVPNEEKIISLYEKEVRVVRRRKAGAQVEFGNSLFLAENENGYIVDYQLKAEQAPSDGKWLKQRMERLKKVCLGKLGGIIADRGFDREENRQMLEEEKMFNGLCPKDPSELAERVKNDEDFVRAQKRRGQTEGRKILINKFLEGTPRAKGFERRQKQYHGRC